MKTKAKDSTCTSACPLAGAIDSANAAVPSEHFKDLHERLHGLVDRQLRAPGGAAILVSEAASMRGSIADVESRVDVQRSPRAALELQAHIKRQQADLAQREAFLATLPEQAKTEPLVLIRRAQGALDALRGTDPEKVREAALQVRDLRAQHFAVQEQRAEIAQRIHATIVEAGAAVAIAIGSRFTAIKKAVANLCDKSELDEIPETWDVAGFVALWREAEKLAAVGQMVNTVLRVSDLLDAVSPAVYDIAARAVGLDGMGNRIAI